MLHHLGEQSELNADHSLTLCQLRDDILDERLLLLRQFVGWESFVGAAERRQDRNRLVG